MSCGRSSEIVCTSVGNTVQFESAAFFDEEGIGCGLAIESSVL